MIFRQLFDLDTFTFTYLLADADTKDAVIIDPVFEQASRDLALIEELGLKLKYCLDTHCHADHITGASLIREATQCQYGLAKANKAKHVDLDLEGGEMLKVGSIEIKVLATPGHTNGCLSYLVGDRVFTGDCLFVRGCGRADFQSGDPGQLYDSIQEKLFTLPDNTEVYPGHDYSGRHMTSIGEEKVFNPRIGGKASKDDFIGYMNALNLPHPNKIKEALPANLVSGKPKEQHRVESWGPISINYGGIPQVDPIWVSENLGQLQVLDVRQISEIEQTGTIPNAIHVPLDQLTEGDIGLDAGKPTVVICRSGSRSGQAVVLLKKQGFQKVANIRSGIIKWIEMGLSVDRKK